jgi:polysaccharide export outer membrane protein
MHLAPSSAYGQAVRIDDTALNARNDQYLIGTGDVLDIRIFNRPQLSRDSVRVDGRGMVRLPLIGEVKASCLTESQLASAIGSSYLEYLRNPIVVVFIKDYQSKPAMVIGAVRAPGRFQMQRRVSMIELISLAGGLTEAAGGRLELKHAPDTQVCGEEITADTETVEWFEIKELMRNNDDGKPVPYVRPGDTINVLEANKAFIVGNVLKPSIVTLKEPTTVSRAVAIAGGTLPDSKLDKVRILRQVNADDMTKTELIVDLRAINKQQAEDVLLRENDIVEVPTASGKRFLRGLLNAISPTVSRSVVRVVP